MKVVGIGFTGFTEPLQKLAEKYPDAVEVKVNEHGHITYIVNQPIHQHYENGQVVFELPDKG